MKRLTIQIAGLRNEKHNYRFDINRNFFSEYGKELVSDGLFTASVVLDKHETFIQANITIEGSATLICDVSLEPFEQPLRIQKQVILKYGTVESDESDDIMVITWNTQDIDIGQLIYEFIALSIPIKKLHPRLRAQDEQETIVYTSGRDADPGPDPRWEVLKKLK